MLATGTASIMQQRDTNHSSPAQSSCGGDLGILGAASSSRPIQEFQNHLEAGHKATSTSRAYASDARQFVNWANAQGRDFRQITPKVYRHYLHDLAGNCSEQGQVPKQYSPATVRRKHSAISGMFDFFVMVGLAGVNPTIGAELPSISPIRTGSRPLLLSDSQIYDLLDAPDLSTPVGIRDRLILSLMVQAGLGVSSICRLNTADIHIDSAMISYYERACTKLEPLNTSLLVDVKRWILVRGIQGISARALFVRLDKTTPGLSAFQYRLSRRGIRKAVKRHLIQAGLGDLGLKPKLLAQQRKRIGNGDHGENP